MNLLKFLEPHKCAKDANLVNIHGGKWWVPTEKAEEFFELYAQVSGFSGTPKLGLVPQPRGKKTPILIDLDFRMSEEHEIPMSQYIAFADKLHMEEGWTLFISVPKKPCYASKDIWKSGVHIFITGTRGFTAAESIEYRNAHLGLIAECFADVPHIKQDDLVGSIWDEGIAKKSTWVLMSGGTKRKPHGGPKHVQYIKRRTADGDQIMSDEKVLGIYKEPETYADLLTQLHHDAIFGQATEPLPVAKPKKRAAPKAPGAKTDHRRILNLDGFKLDQFCAWARRKQWSPNHEDWKTIVSYIAACGYDPSVAAPKLDACFDREGQHPGENEAFLRKIQASFDSSKRTQKRYLVAILDRDFSDMYRAKSFWEPVKSYAYYEDYRRFVWGTGPHDIEDFEQYIQDTIVYIAKTGSFIFRYKNERCDAAGVKFITADVDLRKDLPFSSAGENFYINCNATIDTCTSRLVEKMNNKKCPDELRPKLMAEIRVINQCSSSTEARKIARKYISELPTERIEAKKVVKEMVCMHRIPRFSKMEFWPFAESDPTGDYVFNTFTGFPILKYSPKNEIDVKKTAQWTLLFEVICSSDTATFKRMLDWLSWKFQKPDRKFGGGRIAILKTPKQGCGKSTFAKVLSSWYGEKNIIVLASLKELTDRFNFTQNSKLWVIIDDIDSASKKDVGQLKARVSADSFWYEEKNKTRFKLRCCEGYITTSNCETPLYADSEDRRQMYLDVCPKYDHKNPESVEFFNRVYSEIDQLDVAHAWATFLIGRDISKVTGHQSEDPPSMVKAKEGQVANCMPKPFRFLMEFFARHEWIVSFRRKNDLKWFGNMELVRTKRSQEQVKMLQEHMYLVFTRWVKAEFPRTTPASSTDFATKLTECGLAGKKRDFRNSRPRRVVVLTKRLIQRGLTKVLGTCPDFGFTNGIEFDYLKKCVDVNDPYNWLITRTTKDCVEKMDVESDEEM